MSQAVGQTRERLGTSGEHKKVPETADLRREIWQAALEAVKDVPRRRPLSRAELVSLGKQLVQKVGLSEDHLGYGMVMLNNAFWLAQFLSVPIGRRLLLLPRCLVNLEDLLVRVRELGYRTIVADGSPIVVKIIGEEEMDAIIGVGCLDSMEKAFDKVAQVGVPSIAVPLNICGCKDTEVDTDLVMWFLESEGADAAERTRSYLPLFRIAHRMCEEPQVSDLLGDLSHAGEETARIAREWLRLGGKRLRPFITLAGYKVFHPEKEMPPAVKKVALAIEAFHKASLVHDDIEDDEETRYGEQTIHREYGVPTAINVGDYLLGLGYNLAARSQREFGSEKSAALFRIFSHAHTQLARGQGDELLWRRRGSQTIALAEALRNYMRKTAPAFQAALASGLVMAGVYEEHRDQVRIFSKHLGAAFQIGNDLTDWPADSAHVRPTGLLALALERCDEQEKALLFKPADSAKIQEIYNRHDVFERARILMERFRLHALEAAEKATPENFRELLVFLIETIL